MPKASSSAPRAARGERRAGPLKDLPLELFLPDPNLHQRPNKRVHSPAGPSLFSPTKCRILAEEGISTGASLKSPIRVRAVPVFGGDSPVRKLDFGLPKNSPKSAPVPHSATEPHDTRLTRPHPTLSAFPTSASLSTDDAQEMADYFSLPPNASAGVVQTPRDIPPPTDPQSIHYPGFHVFQDAFVITGSPTDLDPDVLLSPQKDAHKENVAPPRRKPRKSMTAPASSDLKSRLVTPDARLANSVPCTPPRSLATAERPGSVTPTPRRPDVVLTRDTRLTPKLQDSERRELRRRLAEEVDAIDDEDL
ncbi:hypothetical protein C8R46DRAFT_619045 [Mycena filopes]|nr:hypothetical protein C8R46DRAFT_619045 [Mycena filopes]